MVTIRKLGHIEKDKQCTYNVKDACNIRCGGKAIIITYSERVFIALCNVHEPYCDLYPVPPDNIFPHYLITGTIKKRLFKTKCVLISSTNLFETFLFLRRTERDTSKIYIRFHVKCPLFLSDFNKRRIFSTVFRKIPKHKIS
jgi:hypothetical protein